MQIRRIIDAVFIERNGERLAVLCRIETDRAVLVHAEDRDLLCTAVDRELQRKIAALGQTDLDRRTRKCRVVQERIHAVRHRDALAEQHERRVAFDCETAAVKRLEHRGDVFRLQRIRAEDQLVAVKDAVAVGVGI